MEEEESESSEDDLDDFDLSFKPRIVSNKVIWFLLTTLKLFKTQKPPTKPSKVWVRKDEVSCFLNVLSNGSFSPP